MNHRTGRNVNNNGEANVQSFALDPITPVIISPANNDRLYFTVYLAPDDTDVDVYIRLYPAGDNATLQGIILTRCQFGNDSSFNPGWAMPVDNIYTGEISALGTGTIFVTEY